MKRRVVFINFFMLMGIIVLALQFVSSWRSFEGDYSLERIFNRSGMGSRDTALLGVEPMSPSPPFSDFIVISERNLFAEDRRPPSVEEEQQEEETEAEVAEAAPPSWLIRPILRGASNVGGKVAILTVFPGNRATETTDTVHIGDLVMGYTVAEIDARTVTLRWRDHEEIIDMADAEAEQAASAASVQAAITVITVGSAPAALAKTTAKGTGQEGGASIQVLVAGQASQ